MTPSLTIIYCTARVHDHFEWFAESLLPQLTDDLYVLLIDTKQEADTVHETSWTAQSGYRLNVQRHPVKPNVWQGKHRLTKGQWWAKAAALNTGICLAKTDWIACVDDRCVALPGWLKSIKAAMKGNYAVAGAYEKRVNMKVENGKIVDRGTTIGTDPRHRRGESKDPTPTYGDQWFGCNNALPLEWALKVGGYPEDVCDSLGYEDTMFGHLLCRNDFITKYDPTMMVIQDRTLPESESLVKRSDFGDSPNDKSHGVETQLAGSKTSKNSFDINAVRAAVQRGEPFPPPSASRYDWWDGKLISEKFDAI